MVEGIIGFPDMLSFAQTSWNSRNNGLDADFLKKANTESINS
jgi:hypothetical protein